MLKNKPACNLNPGSRPFVISFQKDLRMRRTIFKLSVTTFLLLAISIAVVAQQSTPVRREIDFVSDTQQPMAIEKIKLRSNQNTRATKLILSEIFRREPCTVYMLGDQVAVGSQARRWTTVDNFLDSCHSKKIPVHALLGNHDVMWSRKKGEKNFKRRFPGDDVINYVSITDSVAVIMLNSNFKKLSGTETANQSTWYENSLRQLNIDPAVKAIIVCCHHAPYSNSTIVGSSSAVQQFFVPGFLRTGKCCLFITGHAHAFEHFRVSGKDFLTIGGGGGLHQPLNENSRSIPDIAVDYKPSFHFLSIERESDILLVRSHFLKPDFSGFQDGYSFEINVIEKKSLVRSYL